MNKNSGLKDYQQRTLNVLDEFIKDALRVNSVSDAFSNITGKYFEESLPYQNHDKFIERNIPHVCLRVPTGGGKTLIAANAINVIANNLQRNKDNLVVWFVPSSAILLQTINALKNEKSIYRIHLKNFYDNIEILSVSEALNIKKSTLDNNLTIIVSTFQSFRVDDPEGRKVYSSSGDLMEHFININSSQKEKMLKLENNIISYSLTNVINMKNPIVIVDEAHNAKTSLSFEFLKNINPLFILELTATPESRQYPLNVLYSVSAAELKSEKMLKIPLYLFTKTEWKDLINDAISKRVELEKNSESEARYVRPIMLIQAQPDIKGKPDSLTVKVILYTLINDFKIPKEHIAIQTSTIKELDNINLLDSSCEIRYIITVTALKEGWDCPYAYVLCSLAEISSSVAVEQIIGRIIRQPYTKDFLQNNLNNSYAYVYSKNFIETLNNLRDAFVKNGFNHLELDKLVKRGHVKKTKLDLDFMENDSQDILIENIEISNGEMTISFDETKFKEVNVELENMKKTFEYKKNEMKKNETLYVDENILSIENTYIDKNLNTTTSSKNLISNSIIPSEEFKAHSRYLTRLMYPENINSTENNLYSKIIFEKNSISFKETLTESETERLLNGINSTDLRDLIEKTVETYNNSSPAELGEIFSVPLLTYKNENSVILGEENVFTIFDYDVIDRNWDVKNYLNEISKFNFVFTDDNKNTGVLDINKDGIATTESIKLDVSRESLFVESSESWTIEELTLWLDLNFRSNDINRTDSIIFLQNVIKYLIEVREFKLLELVKNKYKLKDNIIRLISKCRDLAMKEAYRLFLVEEEFKVDKKSVFTYEVDNYPYNQIYRPGYIFKKHYYKEVGDLTPKGEEYECAIYIDNLEEVEFWVRNIPIRKKSSFWLQTSTDRFYPDFVCKLKDGRILVVEYKGEDRWTDDDSKEKRQLGNKWAKCSEGKALFVMPKGYDLEQISLVIKNGMD